MSYTRQPSGDPTVDRWSQDIDALTVGGPALRLGARDDLYSTFSAGSLTRIAEGKLHIDYDDGGESDYDDLGGAHDIHAQLNVYIVLGEQVAVGAPAAEAEAAAAGTAEAEEPPAAPAEAEPPAAPAEAGAVDAEATPAAAPAAEAGVGVQPSAASAEAGAVDAEAATAKAAAADGEAEGGPAAAGRRGRRRRHRANDLR